MLSVRKVQLVTGLKLAGLEVRKAELDFHVLRYVMTAGVSVLWTGAWLVRRHHTCLARLQSASPLMAGLSFMGLLKIEMGAYIRPDHNKIAVQVILFYTFGSITMACSMHNLLVSTFLVVHAQGMMLQGPPNAVHKCVNILARYWLGVRRCIQGSVISLIVAVLSVLWLKVDEWMQRDAEHPHVGAWQSRNWSPVIVAIVCSASLLAIILSALHKMRSMALNLSIPSDVVVAGDLTLMLAQRESVACNSWNDECTTSTDDGGGVGLGDSGAGAGVGLGASGVGTAGVMPNDEAAMEASLAGPPLSQAGSRSPPLQQRRFDLIAEDSLVVPIEMTRAPDEPKWQ